jgi:hypothetical protein
LKENAVEANSISKLQLSYSPVEVSVIFIINQTFSIESLTNINLIKAVIDKIKLCAVEATYCDHFGTERN